MVAQESPQQQLGQMLSGYWLSQAIYVAARLGIADLLREGPLSTSELADASDADPSALYRLLRALASVGVFAERRDRCFELTPMAEQLCSDVPGSQRTLAIMMGEEHYQAWGELLYSVQTGESGFERVYGLPVFEFLAENPEQAAVFDQAMVGVHGRETQAVLNAYDFANYDLIADIGGGNGSVLCAILEAYPDAQGTLFDLPGVIERANESVQLAGLSDRLHLVAGDFFESLPAGANAYLLRHVIHDWDDERAIGILQNVYRAMNDDGRLLIVESIIPPGNEPFFGKLLDLTMLVIPGGQERTEEEYSYLLGAAGFRLVRTVPTTADVSVIEACKA